MSSDFSIACQDCKVKLWIGQGHHGNDNGSDISLSFYSADAEVMENLRQFFEVHYFHELIFSNNDWAPIARWKYMEDL